MPYNKRLKHRALRALDSQQVARRLGGRSVYLFALRLMKNLGLNLL